MPSNNIILCDSFTYNGQIYTIYDPTDVTDPNGTGYINPLTGRPYFSCQPFSKNLAAMQHDLNLTGKSTFSFADHKFGPDPTRFFEDFMRYNYPNRHPNLG